MLDTKVIEEIIRRHVVIDPVFGMQGVDRAAIEIALMVATGYRTDMDD